MKRWKRTFCTALSLCLLFAAAFPVSAAKDGGYTYTVRFFAGRQGHFSGKEIMVVDNLHYGDQVSFSQRTVSLNDNSKYYIRGIRESGKDNNTVSQTPSFRVTGDQDYVVAYGILGDATSYTINYVDEDGNTLAPGETYYGNVGDRPVVAYLYIDGYRPQAYNLTRTLKKDPAENIFTFVYTRWEGGGGGGTTTTEPAAPGPGTAEETPGGTPAATPAGVTVIPADGTVAAGGGGAGGAGGGAAGAGEDAVAAPDEEVPQAEGPEDLIDLDDEDVPLSGLPSIFDIGNDARLLGMPIPAVVGAGVALLGGGWYFMTAKKRKKKEEES